MMKVYWKYLAKALGKKEGNTDREADIVAGIRLVIVLIALITNLFIMASIVHHW